MRTLFHLIQVLWLLGSIGLSVEQNKPPKLDVPYEPTHPDVVETLLQLAEVGEQDDVVDLGCGDGRIVVTAAKLFGAHGRGVDIDPRRVQEAKENVAFEGLGSRVQIERGDIFESDLHDATVVTMYLLDPINLRLRPKLFRELRPGTRLVSHAFHMDDWEPDKAVEHPRARNKKIFLWRIPAHAGGTWKMDLQSPEGNLTGTLKLRQEFQILMGTLTLPEPAAASVDEGLLKGEEIAIRITLSIKGQSSILECKGIVKENSIHGTQRLRIGQNWKEYPWHATRDPVDLVGMWRIHVTSSRDADGTLFIERQEHDLKASFASVNEPMVVKPIESFYTWGASVLFNATVGGQSLRFSGLLENDQGGGTVNSDGWSVAHRWVAAKGLAAMPAGEMEEIATRVSVSTTPDGVAERATQPAIPSGTAGIETISAVGGQRTSVVSKPAPGDEYLNPEDESILVWIPGGEFLMGSAEGNEDERPRHSQAVRGFWLGKYEITNAQFAKFLEANPNQAEPFYWNDPAYTRPNYPVMGLTWQAAAAYCNWAGLRMPTEAEWEYAASGGKQFIYPTSTGDFSGELAACRDRSNKKASQPSPVGSFPPNPFGLFDMAGNVWEFTSSVYRPYPYSATDGQEVHDNSRDMIVLRGGAWSFPSSSCRTSTRQYFARHLHYDFAGLRVAMSTPERAVATTSGRH